MKFKWHQRDSNTQPVSTWKNTQPFIQTGQLIELFWVLICRVHLTLCCYHVTYKLKSESTLDSLPECQETPCSKQALYLKFKWLERDSNQQPLSTETNTQPFRQNGKIIDLCYEYFSVRETWLYVIIMSRTRFRVNQHYIVCLDVMEVLAESKRHIWSLRDVNDSRTHNHLVRKRTLGHLSKLAKWLSCIVTIYMYGAFDCMLFSCQVRVSEWNHAV